MKIEQKLVEYITKTLVDQPDAVRVEREVDDRGVLLTLHVDDEDLGRVIGKGGMTAQSLRLILKALGSKNGERYNLRIADGQPRPAAKASDDDTAAATDDEDDEDDDSEAKTDDEVDESPAADDSEAKTDDEVDESPPEDSSKKPAESAVEKAKSELASFDDLDI